MANEAPVSNAPAPATPSPGNASATTVEGTGALPQLAGFRLISELGRSPKGITYKARRLVEQDVVAVKLFREAAIRDTAFQARLQRSAEASFLLEHPGLARCLGCFEDGSRLLLVMEFARGEPASRALQRNVRFLPPRALTLARQCADALAYAAERRRFHGRLHPGDLIIAEDEARLLGVGLGEQPEHPAWEVKEPHLFEPLAYTAPEALPSRPAPATDAARQAADLYSLGAILYHMLTGATPFRGTDEATLSQERAALSPLVVRWPRGTDRSLPQHAVALVERLLSPDAASRGDYRALSGALDDALRESRGQALPPPARPAPAPLLPVEVAARPAPASPPSPAPLPAPVLAAPAPAYRPGTVVKPRYVEEREKSPVFLIGAVAVVLAYALGLATKTFLLTHSQGAPMTPPTAVNPGPGRAPGGGEDRTGAAPGAGRTPDSQDQGAQRLRLIKELLAEGAAKYDTALLRELHDVLDKAGENSRTGLEARLLIGETEDRLARGGGDTPAARPVLPKGTTEAEEKVFQEQLARVREMTAQQRFGDALSVLKELPPALRLAPYPERAAQEAAQVEQQAKAAFAELSLAADRAQAAGDYSKARGLYQNVQVRWGLPSWAEAAAARVLAINEAEEKAFQTQAALRMQKTRAQELGTLAQLLRGVAAKAYDFRYGDAREEMDKFAHTAQDPESRKLAADYAQLLQDEAGLFTRGRTRLQEQIQRDPNHSSPLQVLNEERQPVADITDFTEQGIKTVAVRGAAGGELVREWRGLDPRQPFVMLQILSDRSSAADRLALAMLAFHQGLRAEADAARSEAGADKTKARKLREIATDLRNSAEGELNAAVQADLGARDRQAAQRAVTQRLAELLANPPPARP